MYGAIIFSLPRKSRGRVKITGVGLVFHIDKKATLHNPEKDAKIRKRSVDMRKPIIWQVGSLRLMVEEALQMVYRYEKQLASYSGKTTPAQRRADVASVLDSLNDYAVQFAKSKVLPECDDIRVLFGLWVRLDTWHENLLSLKQDDYLTVMDEHNVYDNPMCYLLQPLLQAEDRVAPTVIPKEHAADFLASFAEGLRGNTF